MAVTKVGKERETRLRRKPRTEPLWCVVLHNDWEKSMPRVVWVLKKAILGMGLKRATAIMYEAHASGQSVVKRCHKELAELYKEGLQGEGLTISLEPAR